VDTSLIDVPMFCVPLALSFPRGITLLLAPDFVGLGVFFQLSLDVGSDVDLEELLSLRLGAVIL
jgi:hypothetical protein